MSPVTDHVLRCLNNVRHGAHSQCPLEVTDLLAEQYMASAEGSKERREMELRYGASALKRMVAHYQENAENIRMIKEATTACPVCEVRIEKSHGCNHVGVYETGSIRMQDADRKCHTDEVFQMRKSFLL